MANLEYTATTDFNADGEFSECEVDMAWASLQVKALLSESSTNTITINDSAFTVTNDDTLLLAVKAQHALNVTGSVAQSDCGNVSSLPLGVTQGAIDMSSVLGYWRMNEARPSILYDSSGNDKHMVAIKEACFERQDVCPKQGVLASWFPIKLSDTGDTFFNPDGDFTFHMTLGIKNKLQLRMMKGQSMLLFQNDRLFAKLNGQSYGWSFPVDSDQYNNSFIDLFFIKSSDRIFLYIVDDTGVVSNLGVPNGHLLKDNLISDSDKDGDFEIHGGAKPYTSIKNCYFLNRGLAAREIVGNDGVLPGKSLGVNPVFRFKLDGTDDLSGGALTDATTSEKLLINDTLLEEKNWNTGLDYGFPAGNITYSWLKRGTNQYLKYPNFNFTEDFTLSFWMKAKFDTNVTDIIKFVDTDGGEFGLHYINGGFRARLTNGGGFNDTFNIATIGSFKGLKEAFHHISFVVTQGRVEVFHNNTNTFNVIPLLIKYGSDAGKTKHDGMTNCEMRIGQGNSIALYDISLFKGGLVRIDENWDRGSCPSDTTYIEKIKSLDY